MRIVLFMGRPGPEERRGGSSFLRGVMRELKKLGHSFRVSRSQTRVSDLSKHELERELEGANLVIADEWSSPELVARLGRHRKRSGSRYCLLFHDTHQRSLYERNESLRFDLRGFDGALVAGAALCRAYRRSGWREGCFVWHEAADAELLKPSAIEGQQEGLLWIGSGEGKERAGELEEFLFTPARRLGLRTSIFGLPAPDQAETAPTSGPFYFHGPASKVRLRSIYARHAVALHTPRRFARDELPALPTLRFFEALACGAPLVSSPWHDEEALFREGIEYLVARNGSEMEKFLRLLTNDRAAARTLSTAGLARIRARHTCRHRARELLAICRALGVAGVSPKAHAVPSPVELVVNRAGAEALAS